MELLNFCLNLAMFFPIDMFGYYPYLSCLKYINSYDFNTKRFVININTKYKIKNLKHKKS